MTKEEIIKRLAEINEGLSVLNESQLKRVELIIYTENSIARYGKFIGNTAVLKTTLLVVEKECLEEELKEML